MRDFRLPHPRGKNEIFALTVMLRNGDWLLVTEVC